VTWATFAPILVFIGLSVLDLGPMYATDRRQTSDLHHHLMPPTLGAGHNDSTLPMRISTAAVMLNVVTTWLKPVISHVLRKVLNC